MSYQYSWCSTYFQGISWASGRLSRFCKELFFLGLAKQLAQDHAKIWGVEAFSLSLLDLLFLLVAAAGAQHGVPPIIAVGIQKQQGADVCTALKQLGGRSGYDKQTSVLQERLMISVTGRTKILGPEEENKPNSNPTPSSDHDQICLEHLPSVSQSQGKAIALTEP